MSSAHLHFPGKLSGARLAVTFSDDGLSVVSNGGAKQIRYDAATGRWFGHRDGTPRALFIDEGIKGFRKADETFLAAWTAWEIGDEERAGEILRAFSAWVAKGAKGFAPHE